MKITNIKTYQIEGKLKEPFWWGNGGNDKRSASIVKIETDEVADYYEGFFSSLGEDAAFYYVGTDDSIEFANAMVNDQEKVLEPIMKKMEKKNFNTEKSMINFVSKEIKKLMKKRKYQGVIWVLVSDKNLEDTDYDLFEIVESLKTMNKAEVKEILSKINYPGFSRDIISFGMVKDIIIENDGIIINLTITSNNVEKIELVSNNIKKELSQFFSSVIVNTENTENNKDLSSSSNLDSENNDLSNYELVPRTGT